MSSEPPTLGTRIVEMRERHGWTQRELADRAGISVPFLSGIENGKRNVSSEVLLRIADALDASLNYLLRGIDDGSDVQDSSSIPRALHLAAERNGWSYTNVLALHRGYRAVLARRGENGRDWSEEDWTRLYHQFFDA